MIEAVCCHIVHRLKCVTETLRCELLDRHIVSGEKVNLRLDTGTLQHSVCDMTDPLLLMKRQQWYILQQLDIQYGVRITIDRNRAVYKRRVFRETHHEGVRLQDFVFRHRMLVRSLYRRMHVREVELSREELLFLWRRGALKDFIVDSRVLFCKFRQKSR